MLQRSLARRIGALMVLSTAATVACAEPYRLTVLHPLDAPYDYGMSAAALNRSAHVVGASYNYSIFTKATAWFDTTPTDLTTPGELESAANGINDADQIAGYVFTTSHYKRATLWHDTTVTYLGPTGVDSVAMDINNAGQAVGHVGWQATRWSGMTAIALDSDREFSVANAINDSGQAVGWRRNSTESDTSATLWNGTTASNLPALGNNGFAASEAYAINNAGTAVGVSNVGDLQRATLWNGATPIQLQTPHERGVSSAYDINNAGLVVGSTSIAGSLEVTATLWTDMLATDLNTFLDAETRTRWRLNVAMDINDSGSMLVGAQELSTGNRYDVLLSPVPEPDSGALMLVGLGVAGAAALRRRSATTAGPRQL